MRPAVCVALLVWLLAGCAAPSVAVPAASPSGPVVHLAISEPPASASAPSGTAASAQCAHSALWLVWGETGAIYGPPWSEHRASVDVIASNGSVVHFVVNFTGSSQQLVLHAASPVQAELSCQMLWAVGYRNATYEVVSWAWSVLNSTTLHQVQELVGGEYQAFASDQSRHDCVDGGSRQFYGWSDGVEHRTFYQCAPRAEFADFLRDLHRLAP